MLLVPVVAIVAVGVAGLVDWPPHNEQEESRKRITRSGDRATLAVAPALRFLIFAIQLFLYFLKAVPNTAFS